MIKGVIFDLDGTLADTLVGITHFVNRALAGFGYSSLSTAKIRRYVGCGAARLIEQALEDVGDIEKFDEVFALYNKLYDANPFYKLRAYDGIVEMLDELNRRQIAVGILSNKPHTVTGPVAEKLFGDRVKFTLGHKDGMPHKPAQDGVQAVCKALGVTTAECAYVGDSSVDMQTGKAGGMFTVGVSWGFRDREELESNGADAIVDNAAELLDTLLNH